MKQRLKDHMIKFKEENQKYPRHAIHNYIENHYAAADLGARFYFKDVHEKNEFWKDSKVDGDQCCQCEAEVKFVYEISKWAGCEECCCYKCFNKTYKVKSGSAYKEHRKWIDAKYKAETDWLANEFVETYEAPKERFVPKTAPRWDDSGKKHYNKEFWQLFGVLIPMIAWVIILIYIIVL